MSASESLRVGYVLKRYPRYSETFIVNELIAHERAGLGLEIFALRPPNDTHFQEQVIRRRSHSSDHILKVRVIRRAEGEDLQPQAGPFVRNELVHNEGF